MAQLRAAERTEEDGWSSPQSRCCSNAPKRGVFKWMQVNIVRICVYLSSVRRHFYAARAWKRAASLRVGQHVCKWKLIPYLRLKLLNKTVKFGSNNVHFMHANNAFSALQ